MGAPALDKWRTELPDQFLYAGISEQNAINLAAGLSRAGKKPYVYMMACWVARCFEQIRYSCAMAANPITILGTGIGLGYAPAGPAHEPTDDLAYMRAIDGIEIISPSFLALIKPIVHLTLQTSKLRYIRLERSIHPNISELIPEAKSNEIVESGFHALKISLLASGYILNKTKEVGTILEAEHEFNVQILDIIRIKPLNPVKLMDILRGSLFIVTIEEQALDGGFGAAIVETLIDTTLQLPCLRLGLLKAYIFENGSREELLNRFGLGQEEIIQKILTFKNKINHLERT
jgi:transketolase